MKYLRVLTPAAAALVAMGWLSACDGAEQVAASDLPQSCTTRTYSEIGGPFALTNQAGERVSEADFAGRPTLVYFGFTYCPDVCPMTLVTIDRAMEMLPEGVGEDLQTLLISVDPERDTPEAMQSYVASDAFPEGLQGLTGTPDEIAAAADVFKAGYNRVEDAGSTAGYTMDHTSIVYLMDENWSLKTFFTHQETAEDMAACLEYHLKD